MFGKNPKRSMEKGDGFTIYVQEIFKTLQGEGYYTGHPSIFIRLGGCNLACDFCDTEFEDFVEMKLDSILQEVKNLAGDRVKLAVITGGEPFRQNITPLCDKLIKMGMMVQIETNGTIFREIPKEVKIICSPKNQGHGYNHIREDLLQRIMAFKFIISANNPNYNHINENICKNKAIYVQPMDEYDALKNQENLEYCKNLALEKGYIFSLQTHKILGIR